MWDHGGDIYKAATECGYSVEDILDFSANINPLGLPPAARQSIIRNLDRVVDYPQPGSPELVSAIAGFLETNKEYIVPGNGAVEIIYLTARAISPRRTLVVAPAFSEYSRALASVACRVDHFILEEESGFTINVDDLLSSLSGKYQMLVMCNPNNPTGTLVSGSDMEHIIRVAWDTGIYVMVDEVFMDFVDERHKYSMIKAVEKYENLIVVRSLTKFFGIPGLRLGYGVVFSDRLRQAVKDIKEPWSVNVLAEKAGIVALKDEEYIQKTRGWLPREREYLFRHLKSICGVEPFEGHANFLLVKITRPSMDAGTLQRLLLARGILVRNAENFQGLDSRFIRIAVKNREANRRFLNALDRVMQAE